MKPYAVFGNKPRASATSKREVISNIPVFLQYSKDGTFGNIIVWYDKPPYPQLFVSAGNTYWECKEKAEKFIAKRFLDIVEKLRKLDKNFALPRDIIKKLNVDTSFEIVEGQENKKDGMRLTCVKDKNNGNFVYLYTYPWEHKMSSEELLEEYKQRKNNETI